MTMLTVVVVSLLAWMAVSPLLAFWMGRRGHDSRLWGFFGVLLGPLAIPLAVGASSERLGRRVRLTVIDRGTPGTGDVDLLVAVDGSESSESALLAALDSFDHRVGCITMLRVLDFEVDQHPGAEAHARDELQRLANLVVARQPVYELQSAPGASLRPRLVVAKGKPADVIRKMVAAGRHDMVVIGARGHGMSTTLLGSVARELAGGLDVPVLIGPREQAEVGRSNRHRLLTRRSRIHQEGEGARA